MKNSKLQFKIQNFTFFSSTLNSRQRRAGFTLIELVLGMGIFVILVTTVIAIQSLLAQGKEFSVQTAFTIENANSALQTIVNELRDARQSESGSYPLETAKDQEIVFYSNADNDNEIERIRYFLKGTEFKKGTTDPSGLPPIYPLENEVIKIIAEHIQNREDPVFYYYNEDWPVDQINNPLSTPAPLTEITLVKISVRVNAESSRPEGEFTLEPFVQIRSLKTNL